MHSMSVALASSVAFQSAATDPTDVVKDTALVILGAFLGFVSTLVSQRLLDRKKEAAQRRDALQGVDEIMSAVRHAVGHGHDFRNKADWSKELERIAAEDRKALGRLYEPAKQIAWRIRDQSFDHSKPDAAEYCCDELLTDLSLFQLKLLPLVPMKDEVRKAKTRELAKSALVNLHGALPPNNEGYVDQFIRDWTAGKVSVNRTYAMASVLGGAER